MSVERAREHLKKYGLDGRITELGESSATVSLAAKALGCEEKEIAKTLSFQSPSGGCILVVASGDAKVDNAKFKAKFGIKAKMLSPDEVEEQTGHAVGGVCPFGVKESAEVYIDKSVERFENVYPAAGSGNTCLRLSLDELRECSGYKETVDVCKAWQDA